MFGVQNQFVASININGKELSLQLGSIKSLYIVENYLTYVPALKMEIYDNANVLDSLQRIVDGTPITIGIGAATTSLLSIPFRSFGKPKNKNERGRSMWTVIATLDVMQYWKQQPTQVFTGKSSEAIQFIASQCGLTSDVVPTNDKMNWMLVRKSWASLAHNVAEHGFVDSKSIMLLTFNVNKVLRYRNLAALATVPPVFTFTSGGQSGPNTARIIEGPVNKTSSGLMNNIYGYGTKAYQEKMDGTVTALNTFDVTLMSNNLEMDIATKSTVGTTRHEYAPPDSGNTHDNFRQAEYQNTMGLSTFATIMELMIMEVASVQLGDIVKISMPATQDPAAAATYTSNFVVVAKTRAIRGMAYYEKYRLRTQGPMTDPGNVLVG